MGDVWGTAVPNWIMALTAVAALVLAAIGAVAAWKSLLLQREDSHRVDREALRARAREVTAQWVIRTRPDPDRAEPVAEWGLRVINQKSMPVYNVTAEVEVGGIADELSMLHTLMPGDVFIQRAKVADDTFSYRVKRMTDDVLSVTPILKRDWVVRAVSFDTEGERLTWRPRDHASRD